MLRGPDSVQQLAIDGLPRPGSAARRHPAGAVCQLVERVASVDETGLITARGDGTATITVRIGSIAATVPVTVKEFTAGLPVNFANQVVPIFTKLGCNAGGCHGKASGQNGFRLACSASSRPSTTRRSSRKGAAGGSFPPSPEPACC